VPGAGPHAAVAADETRVVAWTLRQLDGDNAKYLQHDAIWVCVRSKQVRAVKCSVRTFGARDSTLEPAALLLSTREKHCFTG
jgi:hypothetical protein